MQVRRGAAQRAESALPDALTFIPVKVGLQPDQEQAKQYMF